MGPVYLGCIQMSKEENLTVDEPIIHKSVGVSGANYFMTACGLYDGTYYTHRYDSQVTCPRCKSIVVKGVKE